MADNGNDDLRRRLEAQEQTSKTQQEALDNIPNPKGHSSWRDLSDPAPRLEVKHPSAKTQENWGLVPLTLETGEIMWMHPDLIQDEQWDSKKPKTKGKSSN